MELRARELDLKKSTAEREQSAKESMASRLKFWGDGLRNTISRMPMVPVEIVSWFIALEKLFDQLGVPAELRSVLLRPYLNDRAKALLARCDLEKTGDYKAIKEFLLREMRLSPSIYWEKFNSLTRETSETFQQFATRLMSLFDLYLESRKVGNSYEKLFDLIIYDRIKSALPFSLSRHVLTLESAAENRWIGRHALVDALDAYVANMPSDKSKMLAATVSSSKNGSHNFGRTRSDVKSLAVESQKLEGNKTSNFVSTPKPAVKKKCFRCGSVSHLIYNCPEKARSSEIRAPGKSVPGR